MTIYCSILKAKPGEFEAFGELPAATASLILPIFEMAPEYDLDNAARLAADRAIRYLPSGSTIGLDCGLVDQAHTYARSSRSVPQWIADRLAAAQITALPVARIRDEPTTLAALGGVASAHTSEAILRIGDDDDWPSATVPALYVREVARRLGLPLARIHLVIDFRAVRSTNERATAAVHGGSVIEWAARVGTWASITIASGAFPASISHLPKGTPTALPRHDAALWRDLTAQGHEVRYGDYAVNSPDMVAGGRGPLPNLRYTDGRRWLVWRESKDRPGNESFYDLAHQVTQHSSWKGAHYSWGDAQVEASAREVRGAGTATQWRAYGTSHHITMVVDRLANLGEP